MYAESCGARRLVLVLLGALGLGGTAELLGAVLPLLACIQVSMGIPLQKQHQMFKSGVRTLLARGLLNLVGGTDADQTVVRLELLQGLLGVVDQSEAGALATTVLCAETEDGDLVLVGLVQVGQLLTELILGDVGAVGVEDVPGNTEMSVARFFQCDFLRCEKSVCGVGVVLPVFSSLSLCVYVCFSVPSSMPIVQFLVHRGKGKGELTRPSACGQAEGCG